MAWVTPRTWTVGEVVTAALLNAHVRDQLQDLDDRVRPIPITFATRPASPIAGRLYYEGDTYRTVTYRNAAWRIVNGPMPAASIYSPDYAGAIGDNPINMFEAYDDPTDMFQGNSQVYARYTGLYQVSGTVRTTGAVSTERYAAIYKNGSTLDRFGSAGMITATSPYTINVAGLVYLVVGDYVQLWTYFGAAGVNVAGSGSWNSTRMHVAMVSSWQ